MFKNHPPLRESFGESPYVLKLLLYWILGQWRRQKLKIAANQDLNEYIDLKYVKTIWLHANVFAGVLEFVLSMKKLFFSSTSICVTQRCI